MVKEPSVRAGMGRGGDEQLRVIDFDDEGRGSVELHAGVTFFGFVVNFPVWEWYEHYPSNSGEHTKRVRL